MTYSISDIATGLADEFWEFLVYVHVRKNKNSLAVAPKVNANSNVLVLYQLWSLFYLYNIICNTSKTNTIICLVTRTLIYVKVL